METWQTILERNGDAALIPALAKKLDEIDLEDDPVLVFDWRNDAIYNAMRNFVAVPRPNWLPVNIHAATNTQIRRAFLHYFCDTVTDSKHAIWGTSAITCTAAEEDAICTRAGLLMTRPYFIGLAAPAPPPNPYAHAVPFLAIMRTRTKEALEFVSIRPAEVGDAFLFG